MKDLKLEIYTPSGMLYNDGVTSVTLPGAQGKFTVLKNHGAIISSLTEGKIRYKINEDDEDKDTISIDVISGFVEVKHNVVTVCLDTVIE